MSGILNEDKLLMYRQQIIVFMDRKNILAAIEEESKKYYSRLTAKKPPTCPPFRFVINLKYTEVFDLSKCLANLMANEPVLFENIIHDVVHMTLTTVLSQLCNSQELSISIQKPQIQIAIRVTSLPYKFQLDGDGPLHNGLGVLRGIIWGHSSLQKYVRNMVWECPEECASKIVTCGLRPTATRCPDCASQMTEMAANRDVGDLIIATVIPAKAIETPKQSNHRYQAIRVRFTDELTNGIEIGQCYFITGLFQYVSQTFFAWNVVLENSQQIRNEEEPNETSQASSLLQENFFENTDMFDTHMSMNECVENLDEELDDNVEDLFKSISSINEGPSDIVLERNIFENIADPIRTNSQRDNGNKRKRYLFDDFDDSDIDFLNFTGGNLNKNTQVILNPSPSVCAPSISLPRSQDSSLFNMNFTPPSSLNFKPILNESVIVLNEDANFITDANSSISEGYQKLEKCSNEKSFFNPFALENNMNMPLHNSLTRDRSELLFGRPVHLEDITKRNREINLASVPSSISTIFQTTRNSPYMFVYSLATHFGNDLMPPSSFMHLKLGLLLSLATIQMSENPPLHILAVGAETLMAQRLMITAANLAKRLIDPIDKADGGVIRKDGWLEGGPLLLASGGVCFIGDWSKYSRGKTSNSVLFAIESGQVRLEVQGGALDAPSPKYNLNCAVWSYWAPPPKAKDQSQLTTMLNVFGICFLADTQNIPDVVTYILQESMSSYTCQPIITEDDYREFLSLISNRKIIIGKDAEKMIREYFVTSRRARSECLPLRALTSLTLLSEAHARLALRGEVIKYDVIMAIWICETSIQQLWGSGIMVAPPVINIKDVTQIDQHMDQFELWLENYIVTVLGETRFNI